MVKPLEDALARCRARGGRMRPADYQDFMRSVRVAVAFSERRGERVQLPADAVKLLSEFADGTRAKPAGRPPMPAFITDQRQIRLIALRELEQFKRIYRALYKTRCKHDQAVERVAARWGLEHHYLRNGYSKPKHQR